VELFGHTVLHGNRLHVNSSIDTLDLPHQKVHNVQDVRLNGGHALAEWNMQLDRLCLPRLQGATNGGVETGPNVQVLDEEIAHGAFHMRIANGEGLRTAGEGLYEAGFVLLAIQSQGESLLAALDNGVCAQDYDSTDQLDGNALLEQVHHQDAGAYELHATFQINALPGQKKGDLYKYKVKVQFKYNKH